MVIIVFGQIGINNYNTVVHYICENIHELSVINGITQTTRMQDLAE